MASITCRIIVAVCLYKFYRSNCFLTENKHFCKTTRYTDECRNDGLLWDCSGLGLTRLPNETPAALYSLAIDISQNDFRVISNESFFYISLRLSSKVKAIYLRNNKLQSIKSRAFSQFKNLCVLDLSGCGLQKSYLEEEAFAGLPNVKFLSIHSNSFQHDGYPDMEIPRLSALQTLSIDVFCGFHFNDYFKSLNNLSSIKFHTTGSPFHLTNITFRGLKESPIYYLDMYFKNNVLCDISEDLFCSFPFIRGIHLMIGGRCDLIPVLRSLKCLQNKTLDFLTTPANIQTILGKNIILNAWNCEYLFNLCAKSVDISSNKISNILVDPWKKRFGQCVEMLNLSHNNILQIDAGMFFHVLNFYPKLRVIIVSGNNRKTSVTPPVIFHSSFKYSHFTLRVSRQLQVIDFSYNYIHLVKLKSEFTIIASDLEEFYISNTNFPCKYMSPLQTPKLKIIDISSNNCNEIHSYIFRFSTNLTTVTASYAQLDFKSFNTQHLFKNLSKLQTLDLSYNGIEILPRYLLGDQNKSMYSLNLDNNLISSIPFAVSMLSNLLRLSVRYNRISSFHSSDIAILNRLNKMELLIEGNPISCTCSKLSSLKWMKENQMRFGDWRITRCLQRNQTLSQFFQDRMFRTFELKCQTKDCLIYSSIFLLVIIVLIISLGVIKRYRVHVDYVILSLRHRWRGVMKSTPKDINDYEFDVFISHSEHDHDWVVNTLYHKLTEHNVKLSLSEKDFIPGFSKAEEMLRCINNSRKVLFVVSETFLESGWESYAVQMTVTHAFHNHRERSMVVLMKDNIPNLRMPTDLRNIWWTLDVIKLSDFENNLDCVWDHIIDRLHSN